MPCSQPPPTSSGLPPSPTDAQSAAFNPAACKNAPMPISARCGSPLQQTSRRDALAVSRGHSVSHRARLLFVSAARKHNWLDHHFESLCWHLPSKGLIHRRCAEEWYLEAAFTENVSAALEKRHDHVVGGGRAEQPGPPTPSASPRGVTSAKWVA